MYELEWSGFAIGRSGPVMWAGVAPPPANAQSGAYVRDDASVGVDEE